MRLRTRPSSRIVAEAVGLITRTVGPVREQLLEELDGVVVVGVEAGTVVLEEPQGDLAPGEEITFDYSLSRVANLTQDKKPLIHVEVWIKSVANSSCIRILQLGWLYTDKD